MIRIINWSSYQSYKDRKPPWVRLHKTLLDNYEFQTMSADARAILPMLWLIASEDEDPKSGLIRSEVEKICFRLRIEIPVMVAALAEMQNRDFIEQFHDESEMGMDEPGVVYFMLSRDENLVKIGYSTQVEWRKPRLERKEGVQLELLFYFSGTRALEKFYHDKFAVFASEKNEWFHYVTDLRDFCNESVTKICLLRNPRERDRGQRTDTETEKEEAGVAPVKPSRPSRRKKVEMSDEEWMQSLRDNPAYSHINIDVEAGKQPTRGRFLNWLNRIDRPLGISPDVRPRSFRERVNRAAGDAFVNGEV
jgi:hypothetical protein